MKNSIKKYASKVEAYFKYMDNDFILLFFHWLLMVILPLIFQSKISSSKNKSSHAVLDNLMSWEELYRRTVNS